MPIITCGINHKTAPISLRERTIFAQDRLALYLEDLLGAGEVKEAVLLSTCNRSELYCDNGASPRTLREWFARQHSLLPEELADALYFYEGKAAIQHIMQVACGLDSMVLGESQILGQMKTAFSESCAAGAVGPLFNRLFQQVFSVAKEVRTHTALGACPVSVSSAAVRFIAETWPEPLSKANVLVVGAGLTIELVLRHLAPLSPGHLVVANRNPDNAMTLATQYKARISDLTRLERSLADADIVIAATGSPQPVIRADMLRPREKPQLMVDIAVPRDIEPSVATLPWVTLHSIDDLRGIMEQGMNLRQHAADKAREVIRDKSHSFMEWLVSLEQVTSTIRAWRGSMEALCQAELARSMRRLRRGEDPSEVLRTFAHALTQKILHAPSVQLREAGVQGRMEMLQLARELFAIPECVAPDSA